MKETEFVSQNKHKWNKFEKLSQSKNNDPDEVSELFTEITEDLSYARTFYPRRSVRVYLNQLSQGVFTKLYKQKKPKIGSFKLFWTEKVPLELYRARKNLLAALIFFLIAVFIGAVSQHYDNDFVRLILGDGYVNSTETRIENGDPMGIYGEGGQAQMFFMITVNNIRVAFITFVLGILATLGSYFLLLKNGIMLGAFQWWFKAKGLLLTTFLAIWIHGAFEISAIVIAGGAGITVGSGLLFPRSYTRIQSLVFSAKRGLLIMASLVPVFIMAGFLESFVTRHYKEMSDPLKLGIILTSFAIIIFYYGFYPFMIAKKHPEKIDVKEVPRYIPDRKIEFNKIRTTGEYFADSLYLFITKFGTFSNIIFKFILPVALGITAYIFVDNFVSLDFKLGVFKQFSIFLSVGKYFDLIPFFLWPIPIALTLGLGYFILDHNTPNKNLIAFFKYIAKPFIWLYLYGLLLFTVIAFFPNAVTVVFIILLGPVLMLIPGNIIINKKDFFTAFGQAFRIEKKGYGEGLTTMLVFGIIGYIFFFILRNPMELGPLYLIDELLRDSLIISVEPFRVVINAFDILIYIMFFGGFFALISISSVLFYYSNREKREATSLYNRLQKFGKHSQVYETPADFD
ncbi:MAG: stage II sporulation protein M [Putridiphycobacter sp.]